MEPSLAPSAQSAGDRIGRGLTHELLAAALEGLYVGRDNKALLVAQRGAILSLNNLAAELCGYSAPALIGQRALADLFGDAPASLSAGTVVRWETELTTAEGARIPIEVVREPLGSRLPGVLVYAIRDLRERRAAAAEREQKNLALLARERDLQIQNLRFDAAINNMPQGLAMFDPANRLLVCNGRFGELFGLDASSLVPGMHADVLLVLSPLVDAANQSEAEAAGAASEQTHALVLLRTGNIRLADGGQLSITRRPMADGGYVVTVEDITERERARLQLEDYNSKLERSNQELQNFAYIASHDLQEPLRKIETFTGRILTRQTEGLPGETLESLGRVQHAAQRMRTLINDLLSYARVDSGNRKPVTVDLNSTLRGVVSDLQVRIEDMKAQIQFADLPEIYADATQMRQLFQNLISNSLKFSRHGVPPVIRIRGTVTRSAAGGQCAVITIADNGIGFDNQYKDQIFKIFQRLHGRQEYEGTGIGLATCRKIVDVHGGEITADGRPGEGATFTVRLPIASQSG